MNGLVPNEELHVFARFHALDGMQEKVSAAMHEMLPPVREEAGCLSIDVFRATRDSRLFFLHSRWVDEAAFDRHATLLHTQRFVATVETLIDHPMDVVRVKPLTRRS